MMKKIITSTIAAHFLFSVVLVNAEEHAHDHGDDPLITLLIIDQLELRNGDGGNPLVVEAQAWIGKDLNKLLLKTDFEKYDGKIEEAELQALYSRAITPYWNLHMGIRHDIKPSPTHTWGVLGVQGLTPYFFDVDAAFFCGRIRQYSLAHYGRIRIFIYAEINSLARR
jgi:copper resistance protein B